MTKLELHFARIEGAIAIAGLALLLLLSSLEIAARNFFHTAIPGADLLNRYLVLWISLLGAVLAVPGQHIKVDALAVLLSQDWRRRLEAPIFFLSALVCGALCWAAARFWVEEWLHAQAAEKWTAALAAIIPASFLLLALHFALHFLLSLRSARRPP
jgi:TRAP-type C4-dicarboxylate transport system permease small subunit